LLSRRFRRVFADRERRASFSLKHGFHSRAALPTAARCLGGADSAVCREPQQWPGKFVLGSGAAVGVCSIGKGTLECRGDLSGLGGMPQDLSALPGPLARHYLSAATWLAAADGHRFMLGIAFLSAKLGLRRRRICELVRSDR